MTNLTIRIAIALLMFSPLVLTQGCQKNPAPDARPPKEPTLDELSAKAKSAPSFENWTQLGLAQLKAKRPKDAVESFRRSTEVNPKAPLAFNNLCAAHNDLRQWKLAMQACRRAVELEPSLQIAKNNLNWAEREYFAFQNRLRTAKKPTTSKEFLDLGLEHYNMGDYDEAIGLWNRIRPGDSLRAVAQNNVASAAILKKDWESARKAVQEARTLQPKNQLFVNNENWLKEAEKAASEKK